jgi:hypothetical protein
MSKNLSIGKRENLSPSESKWDWAIKDAKQRISKLRKAIRVFEKMRDDGEPWRGDIDVSKLSLG